MYIARMRLTRRLDLLLYITENIHTPPGGGGFGDKRGSCDGLEHEYGCSRVHYQIHSKGDGDEFVQFLSHMS
jgi:hypothetical protein